MIVLQLFSIIALALFSFVLGIFYRTVLRLEEKKTPYEERIELFKKELNEMIKLKYGKS